MARGGKGEPELPRATTREREGREGAAAADADLALAKAAGRGEPAAQRELLLRVLPHLRAVSRALLGPSADAEDAAQNAALRVLERVTSFRGEARLESWAKRVATRVCLDALRKRRRLREVGEDEGRSSAELRSAGLDGAPGSASRSAASESLARPVHRYLDALPEAQRRAVVLRHVLDYSVAEIAELLEIPVDTAKSRLLYGRRALRKAIRRDQQADAARVELGAQSPATEGGA